MTMKKAIFILSAAIAVFVSACGNSGETDKQGQLASLKEQREALDEQIKTLEAEVLADNPELAQRKVYRSEEHTSELQSLMRISYAVFCLKKKKTKKNNH